MSDLFEDKARDWDERPIPAQISAGVGAMLQSTVPMRANMHVMDFGAGTGLVCAHVAPHVERVYAVDISESMLAQLAAKPELQDKVEPVCRNLFDEPLGRQVDLIVSAMAMHHIEDTARLLEIFAEHLAPGGMLALADLDAEDGSFHPADIEGVYHAGFDRQALRQLLEGKGFESIEFSTAVEVEKEGKAYPIFLVRASKGTAAGDR